MLADFISSSGIFISVGSIHIDLATIDHNQRLLDSLIVAEWWNPIRDDPRFDEMLELLDSKVTHTEQYLRDHNI